MKLRRDTGPATREAAKRKRERKRELQDEIREVVLPDYCKKRPQCRFCEAEDIRDCISLGALAKDLNSNEMPSLTGKTTSWDKTMVKIVFNLKS